MIRKYAEQILKLYNYIDGLVVTDKKGYIVYYNTFRPDINNLREKEVVDKHILEVYPSLTEETSSIMRVIRNRKPTYNEKQKLETFKGQSLQKVNTTLPINIEDEFAGVVEVSRYIDSNVQKEKIELSIKNTDKLKDKNNMYSLDDIITCEPVMYELKEKISRISQTNSSVLIYGETGTGKELVVQAIHDLSNRSKGPFVSQNCAAIPSTLLESILFGTVKGSFTGARDIKGLFELADGGTLFLDEINSMEFAVQAKLLKAIEEKSIRRIGGVNFIDTDVRIITAINEKPSLLIDENKLRSDLFYRLSVVQLNLPPLRKRTEDIDLLTDHFIDIFNQIMGKRVIGVSEEVNGFFNSYPWPGNVRELENIIEGAFNITKNNLIEKGDLPGYLFNNTDDKFSLQNEFGTESLKKMVEKYEKSIIIKALKKKENKAEAAKLLKISKQALNYKLKKYNLTYL